MIKRVDREPRASLAHPAQAPVLVAPGRVDAAMMKLQPALAILSGALVSLGEPADAPFERFGAPPLVALATLDAAAAAEQAISLVRAVFHRSRPNRALTEAAKRVGNAALGVRRALAREAAHREKTALRPAACPLRKGKQTARLAA